MADRAEDGDLVLALDQGGHASRARVYTDQGSSVVSAEIEVDTHHPGPGRVEQDPAELLASLEACIRDVAEALGDDRDRIRAAGLATQRSTIVCWDRMTGAPLTPAISWQDVRAADRLEGMSVSRVASVTGLRPSPHYGASKLAWCLEESDAVSEALVEGRLAWGPLASFLLNRLCTDRPYVADPANASRTLLMDIALGDWSPELCAAFGIPEATLPACVPSRFGFGRLAAPLAGVPLTVCTGDQSAAIFAFGPAEPGTVFVNAGTGAFLQRPLERGDASSQAGPPDRVDGLLASVVWSDGEGVRYVREATVNGAGSAFDWLADEGGLDVSSVLDRLEDALAAPGEVLFINAVGGLAAPWWRADLSPAFVGTGDLDDRICAVAESVVFLIARCLEVMAEADGPVDRVILTGGISASDPLCQRIADLSERPVERPQESEATSRGLAALVADGSWPMVVDRTFEPVGDAALEARYRRWLEVMERAAAAH